MWVIYASRYPPTAFRHPTDEYLTFLGEKRAHSKQAITDVSLRMRFNAYLASAEFEVLFVTLEDEALDEMVHALLEHPDTIPEEYTPNWG
jgi:hypothetical protein